MTHVIVFVFRECGPQDNIGVTRGPSNS